MQLTITFFLKARKNRLSEEERRRNSFGESFKFIHDPQHPHIHSSSLPGSFPDISQCTCKMSQWHLPTMGENGFIKGLCSGVQVGANALPGFPSMHTIPHVASLGFHGVNVFNSESL